MTHISGALIPLLLLALAGSVMAVPSLPDEFYGTVLIGNAPAPAGTVITAQVGDHTGSLTTKVSGLYGGSATFDERLLVGGNETDRGKTITFTVSGVKANETATYDPGKVVQLNLTAKKGSPGGNSAEFYGTVLIDNTPAPAGTVITARVGDHTGSLTTEVAGVYGGRATSDERLLVAGDETDRGKTVTFTVGGVKATETATYQPKTVVRLNLTAKKGSSGGNIPSGPSGGVGGGSPGGGVSSGPSGPIAPLQPLVVVMEYTGTGPLDSDEKGTLLCPTTIYTQNKDGRLYIDAGVMAKDMFGRALESVTLRSVPADDLPGADAGAAAFGRALKGSPDGATFDPAVEVCFTLTPEEWERLAAGEQFVVRWYNSKTETWESLETTVYPSTRMVTAKVSHFTLFAVFSEAKQVTVPEATPTISWTSTETTAVGQTLPSPAAENSTFWWRVALAVLLVLIGAVYVLRIGDNK